MPAPTPAPGWAALPSSAVTALRPGPWALWPWALGPAPCALRPALGRARGGEGKAKELQGGGEPVRARRGIGKPRAYHRGVLSEPASAPPLLHPSFAHIS